MKNKDNSTFPPSLSVQNQRVLRNQIINWRITGAVRGMGRILIQFSDLARRWVNE